MDTVKSGVRTSEFAIVVVFGVFVLLTGLTIDDGHVSYRLADDMKELLGWAVTAYVGGRSLIKAADVYKKPAEAPSTEDVAKQILHQLNKG